MLRSNMGLVLGGVAALAIGIVGGWTLSRGPCRLRHRRGRDRERRCHHPAPSADEAAPPATCAAQHRNSPIRLPLHPIAHGRGAPRRRPLPPRTRRRPTTPNKPRIRLDGERSEISFDGDKGSMRVNKDAERAHPLRQVRYRLVARYWRPCDTLGAAGEWASFAEQAARRRLVCGPIDGRFRETTIVAINAYFKSEPIAGPARSPCTELRQSFRPSRCSWRRRCYAQPSGMPAEIECKLAELGAVVNRRRPCSMRPCRRRSPTRASR